MGSPRDITLSIWHPPLGCGPQTVLHSGASVKSLTNHFRFRVPAAGTGPITIKALVKFGPANTGEFYRPPDLVLQESVQKSSNGMSGDDANRKWLIGPAGGSCDAACASTRQACDEDTMEAGLKTPTAAASALSSLYPCNGPYIMDCEEISVPFTTEFAKERRCWYGDGMCESNGPESHQGTQGDICVRPIPPTTRDAFVPAKNRVGMAGSEPFETRHARKLKGLTVGKA